MKASGANDDQIAYASFPIRLLISILYIIKKEVQDRIRRHIHYPSNEIAARADEISPAAAHKGNVTKAS